MSRYLSFAQQRETAHQQEQAQQLRLKQYQKSGPQAGRSGHELKRVERRGKKVIFRRANQGTTYEKPDCYTPCLSPCRHEKTHYFKCYQRGELWSYYKLMSEREPPACEVVNFFRSQPTVELREYDLSDPGQRIDFDAFLGGRCPHLGPGIPSRLSTGDG